MHVIRARGYRQFPPIHTLVDGVERLEFSSPPPRPTVVRDLALLAFDPSTFLFQLTTLVSWVMSAVAASLAVRPLVASWTVLHLAEFGLVHSRKSQSYEPLLLENEREAVADLLQFLESELHPHLAGSSCSPSIYLQIAQLRTSSRDRLSTPSLHSHSPTMSTCSAAPLLLSPK